ncbi:hypothetical protein AB0K52_11350 [Glycomyces sp. NPDC049804]
MTVGIELFTYMDTMDTLSSSFRAFDEFIESFEDDRTTPEARERRKGFP